MRGEWIEIQPVIDYDFSGASLSPCGESGLKCDSDWQRQNFYRSLPMRGEWIEIQNRKRINSWKESLPMRGEWIEMPNSRVVVPCPLRLSPCGESGLKLCTNVNINRLIYVSPHAGRVD